MRWCYNMTSDSISYWLLTTISGLENELGYWGLGTGIGTSPQRTLRLRYMEFSVWTCFETAIAESTDCGAMQVLCKCTYFSQ